MLGFAPLASEALADDVAPDPGTEWVSVAGADTTWTEIAA